MSLMALFCLSLLVGGNASAAPGDEYFEPLGWYGVKEQFRVPESDTRDEVCDAAARTLNWSADGSVGVVQSWIYASGVTNYGSYDCRRYRPGPTGYYADSNDYVAVVALCRRSRTASVLTGLFPSIDHWNNPPCYCFAPNRFDRSTERCVAAPTCTWYPNNVATECGKTVQSMTSVPKAATDPTRLFHQQQTCIAKASCNARCAMENCNWLKAVLPDFVTPYLTKGGNWTTIEARCRQRSAGWLADRLCASEMARYHIEVDLMGALSRSGCGSDSDWTKVFDVINSCSGETFNTDAEKFVATFAVRLQRDRVRNSCMAGRSASGLDRYTNVELKGAICTP